MRSVCDCCGDVVRDIDAGFSPGLHMMQCPCGGVWRRVADITIRRALTGSVLVKDRRDGRVVEVVTFGEAARRLDREGYGGEEVVHHDLRAGREFCTARFSYVPERAAML